MAGAYGNAVLDKGARAGGTIAKCRFVKFSAEDTVVQVTASTDLVAGVAIDGVTAAEQTRGKGVSVRRAPGIAELDVGTGGVTAGGKVMSDVNGQAIPATGAGNQVCGIALQTKAAGLRAAIQLTGLDTI